MIKAESSSAVGSEGSFEHHKSMCIGIPKKQHYKFEFQTKKPHKPKRFSL